MTPEILGNASHETESEAKTYGQIVRERRKAHGFSQAYLASGAELNQGYVSQIENNKVANPSFAVRTRIAGVLGFSIDEMETADASNAIFLEPRATYLRKIMLELPAEQQELVAVYIKLTFPQTGLEKVTYLSEPQPLLGKELGNKIKEQRHVHEWGQNRLANEASISQAYLSQLENGEVKTPSLAVLHRITSVLKMDIKDLAGVTIMEVPEEIASVDQFLRDENVPQDLKDAKWKSLMSFLETVRDPVFQENFVILPRNRRDISTPAQ